MKFKKWVPHAQKLSEQAKTMTALQISKEWGCARSTMNHVLNALKIKAYNPNDRWRDSLPQLIELAKGMTSKQLAQHYGLNVDSMRQILRAYSVKPKPDLERFKMDDGYKARIIELGKTKTIAQIAKEVGKSYETIRKYLVSNKIVFVESQMHPAGFWQAQHEIVVEMMKTKTTKEIAAHYGVSPKTMRSIFCRLGLKVTTRSHPQKKASTPRAKKPKDFKSPVIKKTTELKQTKVFTFEKQKAKIVFPEGLKVQVIKPNTCNDWRNAMARPSLSTHKEISWRY